MPKLFKQVFHLRKIFTRTTKSNSRNDLCEVMLCNAVFRVFPSRLVCGKVRWKYLCKNSKRRNKEKKRNNFVINNSKHSPKVSASQAYLMTDEDDASFARSLDLYETRFHYIVIGFLSDFFSHLL